MQTVSDVLQSTHYDGCWKLHSHHDCALARIATLEAQWAAAQIEVYALRGHVSQLESQLAAVPKWTRITLRDETLPPDDLTGVEMVIVTKEDGEFLAGTTGENLRRLAASGNPKIKNYYWRKYISPEADNA